MDCRRVTASDETRDGATGPAGKIRDHTRACRNRTRRALPVAAAVKRPAGPCHRMGVHTAVCSTIKTIALERPQQYAIALVKNTEFADR